MTDGPGARATRLLLWYPPAWRVRYGDEFAELLAAEVAERPRDRRRTVNVAFSGVRARLPGTGGHLLTTQGLVPAGVVAFGWSITMWITSYWAHPPMLGAFPATQIAWMTLTPLAACGLMTSMAQLIRRLDRSPRALCFETWLGRVAGGGMLVFLCGVLRWLSSAEAGQRPVFHVGSIDVAGLTVLALVAAVGMLAMRSARPAAVGR